MSAFFPQYVRYCIDLVCLFGFLSMGMGMIASFGHVEEMGWEGGFIIEGR